MTKGADKAYHELLDKLTELSKECSAEELLDGLINATADVIIGTNAQPFQVAQEYSVNLCMLINKLSGGSR
ncbi:MAG: hypothetical protein WCQ23_01360 [Candidatus Methanomethylophilaceae archaeon]|jgi:hypothetical protein